MESPEQTNGDKASAEPRNQHACLGCRQKKLKCMPSDEDEDCCRRCDRLGLDCVIPEKKQRLKRSRLRGRVDQLENSYSQILSLLSNKSDSQTTKSPPIHHAAPTKAAALEFAQPLASQSGRQDDNSNLKLESVLPAYRRMSAEQFPYVIIPEEVSAAQLLEKRPLLSQAIGIATSWCAPEKQGLRRTLFLQILGAKYFVECERSLDLLQALLVYFGWCQWYSTPIYPQAYRLASLVVNLALELDVHQKPLAVTQHQLIVPIANCPKMKGEPLMAESWSHEVKRAYIGAYSVSQYCSVMFRKPSSFTYTTYLQECATALGQNPHQFSDTLIIHSVTALRSSEDVTRSFDHGSSEIMQGLQDGSIQTMVKALTNQIDTWRNSMSPTIRNCPKIVRQLHLCKVYIYEVGLYQLLQGQAPSVTRIQILLDCFNETRAYLDLVGALTAEALSDWSVIDWRSLNFAIMINSKSAVILDSFCYCDESPQRATWVDNAYGLLCTRAQSVAEMAGRFGDGNFLDLFVKDWNNAKSQYQQSVQQALARNNSAVPWTVSEQMPLQTQYFDIDSLYNMTWNTFGDYSNWMDV